MLTPDRARRIEILRPDGSWLPSEFGLLETDDVFRMSEPDGTPVVNQHGRREYRVMDMPRVPMEPLDCEPDLLALSAREACQP